MGAILSICRPAGKSRSGYSADNSGSGGINELSDDQRPAVDKTIYYVHSKQGETIARGPGVINGLDMIVENCTDCVFYICDHLAQITIDDCTNCQFYIGPVGGSIFIRTSTGCHVSAACQQFRTREVENCEFKLFCTTQPVIEVTKNVKFGCLDTFYPLFTKHLASAHMPCYTNQWSGVYDFTAAPGNWDFLSSAISFSSDTPWIEFPESCLNEGDSASIVPITYGAARAKPFDDGCLLLFPLPKDNEGKIDDAIGSIIQRVHKHDTLCFIQMKEWEMGKDDSVRLFGRQDSMSAQLKVKIGETPVAGLEVNGVDACTEMKKIIDEIQQSSSVEKLSLSDFIYYSPDSASGRQEISEFFDTVEIGVDMEL